MGDIQLERITKINELIKLISKTGRGFFGKDGEVSYFIKESKLFYIDKCTKQKIYPYLISKNRAFSEGGTLWSLVNDFRRWIITGESSDGFYGNGGLYATCWGYPIDDMNVVVQKAKDIGYIDKDAPTFKENCIRHVRAGNDYLFNGRIRDELIEEIERYKKAKKSVEVF